MNRILLRFDNKKNCSLLAEMLSGRYEVLVADSDARLDEKFDLCILDGPALNRIRSAVEARKSAERPFFLPFLLVTLNQDINVVAQFLSKTFDELIVMPIQKVVLLVRVENLIKRRHESTALSRLVVETSPAANILIDVNGNVCIWNPAAEIILGYKKEELIGRRITDALQAGDGSLRNVICKAMQGEEVTNVEGRMQRKDGSVIDILFGAKSLIDRNGAASYVIVILNDITLRKRNELKIKQRTRLYAVLSAINYAIVRIGDTDKLFIESCRIATVEGGFKAAWIGKLDEQSGEFVITALEGFSEEGLQQVEFFLNNMSGQDDNVCENLKSGSFAVFNDIEKEECISDACRDYARRLEFNSFAVFPLKVFDGVWGCCGFVSSEANVFDEKEINLLNEMVMDLDFGIETIYNDADRERAEKEVKRLNVDLERRVQKRTADLEFANKELEAFAYSVSHDLRSPLRAISGFSRFLQEDFSDKLAEDGNELIEKICANVRRMQGMIDDLLNLSRVSRGELKLAEVNMSELVNKIYNDVSTEQEKGEFVFSVSDMPDAFGDYNLICHVWDNLVSNALKFSAKSDTKRIEVGGEAEDEMNVYYIKDFGVGFNPERKDQLFDVFQRAHSEKDFKGAGIGLSIVQRIIKRHGGEIWAEGKPNEGSTFWFTIPGR